MGSNPIFSIVLKYFFVMYLVEIKGCTPGLRFCKRVFNKKLLSAYSLSFRKLFRFKHGLGGRNFTGRMVLRNRGALIKKLYRFIDYNRVFFSVLLGVLYDPNRSNFVGLFLSIMFFRSRLSWDYFYNYSTGLDYKLLVNFGNFFGFDLLSDRFLVSGSFCIESLYNIGSLLPLCQMPIGFSVCFLESSIGFGSSLIRSAGSFGKVLKKSDNFGFVFILLPSGVIMRFLSRNVAQIGRAGLVVYCGRVLGKAGTKRLLGFRSCVRGVAKNPVDHPHGGRTKGGRPSVSPWGFLTK